MASNSSVLILTPMKDASHHLDGYFAGLHNLNYPKSLISLGFLEGDSRDDTASAVEARLPELSAQYASAKFWRKDFGFQIPVGMERWEPSLQLERRKALARARNHLLFHALDDQDWVLWLDVDVIQYPADLIQQMLEAGRDIVHPHCVREPGGRTFDRNAWKNHGAVLMEDLRGGADFVRLDAVGGTALFIRADVHRDGLIFPPFLYGGANSAVRSPHHPLGAHVRGEIETEGLGIMALDMGYQCWGMPNFEIIHSPQ
jgi:GT2 family glycosyltransferase